MSTKKPNDITGRKLEQLKADNLDAIQERANSMSMATAQAAADLVNNVIDATKPNRQTVIVDEPTVIGDNATVEIRVVEDLENMTLGAGNNYSFKAGQRYTVSKHVAQHLKEKGYLANVL